MVFQRVPMMCPRWVRQEILVKQRIPLLPLRPAHATEALLQEGNKRTAGGETIFASCLKKNTMGWQHESNVGKGTFAYKYQPNGILQNKTQAQCHIFFPRWCTLGGYGKIAVHISYYWNASGAEIETNIIYSDFWMYLYILQYIIIDTYILDLYK